MALQQDLGYFRSGLLRRIGSEKVLPPVSTAQPSHTSRLDVLIYSEDTRDLGHLHDELEARCCFAKNAPSYEHAKRWVLQRKDAPPAAVLINLAGNTCQRDSGAMRLYRMIRQGNPVVNAKERFGGWGLDVPIAFILPHEHRQELEDQLADLEIFPDMFFIKPYTIDVLYKRLRAFVEQRRTKNFSKDNESDDHTVTVGGVLISPQHFLAAINDEVLALTETEFKFLHVMVSRSDKLFVSFEELAYNVLDWKLPDGWEKAHELEKESIRNLLKAHKANLAKKLKPYEKWVVIKSVSGRGYRLATVEDDDTQQVTPVEFTCLVLHKSSKEYAHLSAQHADRLGLYKDNLTIGSDDCDIIIPHPAVSRVHARIIKKGEAGWHICDIGTHGNGSTNGTHLYRDGQRWKVPIGQNASVDLTHGDLIEFAPQILYRFETTA